MSTTRRRTQLFFSAAAKPLVEQHHRDSCSMRFILDRYQRTGVLPNSARSGVRQYLDVPDVIDYHTALNTVTRANQMFELLPSELRREFGETPTEFLRFVSDPNNSTRLAELGIIDAVPAVETATAGDVEGTSTS